ncbi:intraflagellar transport complex 25-27 [Dunaliella salina]|uniref:Intraflagellar transport complex 25-27 n=1 Tax=Dunaliella salina TaxID=3046 RepID=A0ABQ7H8C9_DUNSA|nr:intraflagellar transport complex 25-27 [Dunaliella salina]|eukprot:KAF5843093.1 intraflagellar transport complex 25-27 [Dunaliella salina]
MKDYAREENGAKIIMATSVDDRFPPEHMLDGKDSSFWMTTVKKLAVEKSEKENSGSFEKVFEVELASRGDRLQTEVHQVSIRAKYLKFTLLSGHCENAAVNRISVVGEPVGS